jgi:hypothetical protein
MITPSIPALAHGGTATFTSFNKGISTITWTVKDSSNITQPVKRQSPETLTAVE